jgi:hypothetical protein
MIRQSLSNTNEKLYHAFFKKNLPTKHSLNADAPCFRVAEWTG